MKKTRAYIDDVVEFKAPPLELCDLPKDATEVFGAWYESAESIEPHPVNFMCLATVSEGGGTNSRMVLLKKFSEHNFFFYTNYESRKSQELGAEPRASLNFFWPASYRQVTIRGVVERGSDEDSEGYFKTRPRGSQIGAWSSPQSTPISRDELLLRREKYEQEFEGREVTRPAHWGGYVLCAHEFVFWQGRPDRMHDRFLYRLEKEQWTRQRLAP